MAHLCNISAGFCEAYCTILWLKTDMPIVRCVKGGECLMWKTFLSVTYYQQLNHVYNFNEIQYRSSLQKFVKQP